MGERIGIDTMRISAAPPPEQAKALIVDMLTQRPASGPRRLDQKFALYGAGKLGRMAMDFFGHVGLKPSLVVDANAEAYREDQFWHGQPLVSPCMVQAEAKRSMPLVVSIATICFTELAETLRAQGWQDIVPIYDVTEAYRDRYPLGNGWFMEDIGADSQTAIQNVLTEWSDNISRAHHLQFIAWHRLRQDWVFDGAPVDIDHRYFIPEVVSVLGERERFVDVGAHIGEVSEAFRHVVGGKFEEIVLFEPDQINMEKVKTALSLLPEPLRCKHRLLSCALSRRGGKKRFFAKLGYGSQLSEFGADMAEVAALDDLDLAPTYIKMHLEGHELEALQGAERTLRSHRPIVVVTIYHSDSGVWKLPNWLMRALDNYRHYLRLHSWCGTGALMYCIPEERYE